MHVCISMDIIYAWYKCMHVFVRVYICVFVAMCLCVCIYISDECVHVCRSAVNVCLLNFMEACMCVCFLKINCYSHAIHHIVQQTRGVQA